MRRPTKAFLKESALTSAKGIVAGTAVFAAVAFSPALQWAGYRRLSWTEATSLTLKLALVLVFVFATTSVIGWLWPKLRS
jgi:hypothetical protein